MHILSHVWSGDVSTLDGNLTIDGQAKLSAADLSVFSGLAQRELGGSVRAEIAGKGTVQTMLNLLINRVFWVTRVPNPQGGFAARTATKTLGGAANERKEHDGHDEQPQQNSFVFEGVLKVLEGYE